MVVTLDSMILMYFVNGKQLPKDVVTRLQVTLKNTEGFKFDIGLLLRLFCNNPFKNPNKIGIRDKSNSSQIKKYNIDINDYQNCLIYLTNTKKNIKLFQYSRKQITDRYILAVLGIITNHFRKYLSDQINIGNLKEFAYYFE